MRQSQEELARLLFQVTQESMAEAALGSEEGRRARAGVGAAGELGSAPASSPCQNSRGQATSALCTSSTSSVKRAYGPSPFPFSGLYGKYDAPCRSRASCALGCRAVGEQLPSATYSPIQTSPNCPDPSFLTSLRDCRGISHSSWAQGFWGARLTQGWVSLWHNPSPFSALGKKR